MKIVLKLLWIMLMLYDYVTSTEVSVSSHEIVSSSVMEVALPVFSCKVKHSNYTRVLWYKDSHLLRNGSASLQDHIFFVTSLLQDTPLKLQGYYWCETDVPSIVHKYLFTIRKVNDSKVVNTYRGKILTSKVLTNVTKQDLEEDMQDNLFAFLPKPNTYVTDIQQEGLEVSFFVYSRHNLDPRKRHQLELMDDEEELDHILDSLNTPEIEEWVEKRKIENIVLRSTLGCYSEVDSGKNMSWPYAYRGEVVIPKESCSSKNGLSVTRMCTGSFNSGASWGKESGKCDQGPSELTSQLTQVLNSDIHSLEHVMKMIKRAHLSVTDLHILTDILTRFLKSVKFLQPQVAFSGIFSIIDSMLENTKATELVSAKHTIYFTTRILKIIDSVLESERKDLALVSKKNILAYVKSTEQDHVIGASVISNDVGEASVEYLVNRTQKTKSKAFFFLPEELVSEREIKLPIPCHLQMVFFKDWILFPNPKNVLLKRNYKILSSPVFLVSLSGGPAWNLSSPIHLYFQSSLHDLKVEDPVCVHYDVKKEDWSLEGCEYVGLEKGFYHCQCYHLSIFSVILSVNPEKGEYHSYKLGTALYVGCSLAMIPLAFSILLYVLSKKWRQKVDHSILFHLFLSFFGCLLTLFLSEEKLAMKCFVLSLMLHYFLIATFGWILVHAVVHKMRFSTKTDLQEVPHFQLKAAVCTWGGSAVIIFVIWITRDDKHHNLNSCLLPLKEISRAAVIPIVFLILVVLCLNLCSVYAITCRYKQDYLMEDSSYHESVIKFRVVFTISFLFVISWVFGLFALHNHYKELRVLFSICIVLTAYYTTLFFVFYDTSFREMCQQCTKKQSSQNEDEVVTFTTKPAE